MLIGYEFITQFNRGKIYSSDGSVRKKFYEFGSLSTDRKSPLEIGPLRYYTNCQSRHLAVGVALEPVVLASDINLVGSRLLRTFGES